MSTVDYARAGDTHVAYRVIEGERGGDHDVVMVAGGFFPMETLRDDPPTRRLVDGLADLGRLVCFDRRGVGMSDSVTDWETPLVEQWADDLAAVVEAAGLEHPTVFSWHTTPVAPTCAARHPELLGRLVLFNPGSVIEPHDDWVGEVTRSIMANVDGESDWMARILPNRWSDRAFREWSDRAGRTGASPADASRLLAADFDQDVFSRGVDALAGVTIPTLVIVRTPGFIPSEFFARTARHITGAALVDLSPGDLWPISDVDEVLAEISAFVTGERRLPEAERVVVAVLFTDLVDSTATAASVGDAAWKRLLDRHDECVREVVGNRGGSVVKHTGDGVVATLPSASAAARAASEIRVRLAGEGLLTRAGIHVGEVDRRGDDISGIAVHIAARVMGEAAADQIAASHFAAGIAGSEFDWVSIGARELKGIDGAWELFALSP